MAFVFAGFDWDRGDRDKCQMHGVPLAVIENLFHGSLAVFPDPLHSKTEERFKAIGDADDGRKLLIVFTLRRQDEDLLIRPISARYMHRKEVEHYEETLARAEKR
jgi:uncharacterized DUF497 family protein